jgi:DNA-binding GntR family transcriptional regulator
MSSNGDALVDELASRIQARVLSGELQTGTWLRQESLAEEFGVSRTPVREALRKLQATGLVEVQPRRGALVRGLTAREIREAYEVRAELEGLAAELAATRVRAAELERMRDAQALFRQCVASMLAWRKGSGRADPPPGAYPEWNRGNGEFHLAIQESAGNRRLAATLADLHRTFPRDLTWIALGENASLLEENVAQHEAILEAIERHDAKAARRRMTDHVRGAGELVTRRFEETAA